MNGAERPVAAASPGGAGPRGSATPRGPATRSRVTVLAAVTAVALVATACGSGADPAQPVEEGVPEYGGTLVYGIESDTANAWAPYRATLVAPGLVTLSAVSDPLFGVTADGEAAPVLVESAEPNADFSEWTLRIRDGITFHDGTPLDAAAVKFNLETCQHSPPTASRLAAVAAVAASGQDVTITTNGPWASLPAYLTYTSPCSYMVSPQWLGSLADVPHRQADTPVFDAALAATPADGDPARPVGLGAFVFESYTPGNGNAFRAVRNDDYWRGADGITGENLPYLDAVEAVVIVDTSSRVNALRSGQIDALHTGNADTVAQLLEDEDLETVQNDLYGETSFLMPNLAEGPELDPAGTNEGNPMQTLACRRALAHAIDLERFADVRGAGIETPANGPFQPGVTGYLEDTGYPAYDLAAAESEMGTCLSEQGSDSVEFAFYSTDDPFNVESGQLIASMWEEAFGDRINVTITPFETGRYIGSTLNGDFELVNWRGFEGRDPDEQRPRWHSSSALPIGQPAINFGRYRDDVVDESLDVLRSNTDADARRGAAEAINRQLGEQVYYFWLTHLLWGISSAPHVNGIETATLPDGGAALGPAFGPRHQLAETWCAAGSCEE